MQADNTLENGIHYSNNFIEPNQFEIEIETIKEKLWNSFDTSCCIVYFNAYRWSVIFDRINP